MSEEKMVHEDTQVHEETQVHEDTMEQAVNDVTGDKKKVVIVMYKYSVVVKGIEHKLTDCGYKVKIIAEEFDKVKRLAESTMLFLIFLPNGIADDVVNLNHLNHIHNVVWEHGKSMMLIGDKKDKADLMKKNHQLENFVWLDRPVKMDELELAVEKALEVTAKKKILIVDDDPSYAKMVREWIKADYQAVSVTGGMNAISLALKTPVDLILLDYEMPVVDGPQVFQMLKQDPDTENIPVIFLTGVGSREGVERVMALRPDGYILKTTTKEKLLESIKGVLTK